MRLYDQLNNVRQFNKRFTKAKVRLWPFLVLIIVLVLILANTNGYYQAKVNTIQESAQRLNTNFLRLETTFKEYQREQEKRNGEVDKKLQSRAEAKAKLASVQSSRPVTVQRPVLSGGCENFRTLISQYNWPVETMIAICNVESGGNVNAINATDHHETCLGSYGLFQISCDWYNKANLYDAATNIRLAYGKYVGGGLNPWINTVNKLKAQGII